MKKRIERMAVALMVVSLVAISLLVAPVAAEWKETEISRSVSLPKNINIIPPDPNLLPPKIVAFSGRYEGVWKDSQGTKAVVIFEKISTTRAAVSATVIYGWAGSKGTDWERFEGEIRTEPKPRIVISKTSSKFRPVIIKWTFELEDDGTVSGVYERSDSLNISTIKMEKVN